MTPRAAFDTHVRPVLTRLIRQGVITSEQYREIEEAVEKALGEVEG